MYENVTQKMIADICMIFSFQLENGKIIPRFSLTATHTNK